jgi:prolyl-tRNA synthetase
MVSLVRGRITSYKQLPINLYQINLKFRDEARPRFGLMRGREFLMKDGYSFHANEADMKREFDLMEATYRRIFERLELDFRVVEADSGAIGGSGSKEFMVLADAGEDTIVVCGGCEYAANIEAAKRKPKQAVKKKINAGKIHTPNISTIDDLAKFLDISADQTIKAVAKKALFDKGEKIALFFVRGSDQLEPTKALNAVKANDLIDVTDEELRSAGIVAGFVGLGFVSDQVLVRCDQELMNETDMVTGADEKDHHIAGFAVSDQLIFADLVAVEEGDKCPHCGGVLGYKKGIEVGHIFQLGTRYSEPLGANFLDENGKSKPFVMGTYGIGVSRLLSASLEQFADTKGAVWQKSVAPYMVDLIVGNLKDANQQALSEELYERLSDQQIEVIYDDRSSGFGFKMSDFELIGFPFALIVGKKAKDGLVEIVVRKTDERLEMTPDGAVDYLVAQCR